MAEFVEKLEENESQIFIQQQNEDIQGEGDEMDPWNSKYEPTERGGEHTVLHAAVENNDLDAVMEYLKQGIFVGINDPYGLKPLDLAVELGHYELIGPLVEYGSETYLIMDNLQRSLKRDECLEQLMKFKISINNKGCFGRTLLHNVFRDEPTNIRFIEKLIDLGADLHCFDFRKDGLIHSMANSLMEREDGLPLLMAILKRGINVETLNLREQTPLQLAIINRKEYMIQPLLEYGAIISNPTFKYPTLLDEAFDRGMYGCLKEMMRHLIVKEIRGQFVEEHLKLKMTSHSYVKYYQSCYEEIQELKFQKIPNTPLSYYDLVFKPKKGFKYLKDRKIVEELSNRKIASSFYCTIIKGWEEAKLKRHLEDSVLKIIPEVFFHLPNPCVRKVLEKVDEETLEYWINHFSSN